MRLPPALGALLGAGVLRAAGAGVRSGRERSRVGAGGLGAGLGRAALFGSDFG